MWSKRHWFEGMVLVKHAVNSSNVVSADFLPIQNFYRSSILSPICLYRKKMQPFFERNDATVMHGVRIRQLDVFVIESGVTRMATQAVLYNVWKL